MFVPGGWWHGVLNLDLTIAVTQNICNSGNFDRVWRSTRKGRKRLSVNFLKQLAVQKPALFEKATLMNKVDKFVMWDQRDEFKNRFVDGCSSSSITSSSSSSSSECSSDSESSSASSSFDRGLGMPPTKRQKVE